MNGEGKFESGIAWSRYAVIELALPVYSVACVRGCS